ncbi:anhydro-N-acetylmuramic acid kinase [Agromyces archimandritae]|uniref:Anhydro-N-acetylmuramic acid kinase n=1 Tax=Agromyces archimandritae TaxID=2781962 RepID=A0A975FPA7_9MICO|nr:anhydro-N-acetylmuramic acid kinase [Agromyces archimandritae]QTX05621.1 anhydro-N-acetylmuramic acid kinase [Agromyces archimandritae]
MRVLSLQSGTSADAIDVAVVEFAVRHPSPGVTASDDAARPARRDGRDPERVADPEARARASTAAYDLAAVTDRRRDPEAGDPERVAAAGARAAASTPGIVLELTPVATREVAWEPGLRRDILQAAAGLPMDAGAWCRLDTRLGRAFAAAAAEVLAEAPAELVVSHGQTVFHWAEPDGRRGSRARGTLQLGEPAWIAERTGLPVVSHVRAADIAAGGEGAPLMGVFDRLWLAPLARAAGRPVATVNLGGIANVQIVDAAGGVLAFDTGPGNGLIDAAVGRAAGLPYDVDGRFAAAGRIDEELLGALLAHPYFAAAPPKTTGRETFDLAVVDAAVAAAHGALTEVPTADLAATLTELTARTVVDAVAAARPGVGDAGASATAVEPGEAPPRIRRSPPNRMDAADSIRIRGDLRHGGAEVGRAGRASAREDAGGGARTGRARSPRAGRAARAVRVPPSCCAPAGVRATRCSWSGSRRMRRAGASAPGRRRNSASTRARRSRCCSPSSASAPGTGFP